MIPRRERRGPRQDRRDRLFEAIASAQRFYAERLGRPGNAAAKYLESRGVPRELWTALSLGHAPDAWDSIAKALSPGFPEDLLIEAGLLQPRAETKGSYDRFRDRLLFVVKDERGRPVGFGGRTLSPEGEPKYLNSPESPVFSKKRLLYGLFEARESIRKQDRVVLVEGYFDHLALVRAGVRETVASMGTALTPEQAERLRRLTQHAIVCYDGDSAGRNATRGALQLLLAQGFEAKVARMPLEEDPDDLLQREGPEALAEPDRRGPRLPDLALRGRPAAGGGTDLDRQARAGRDGFSRSSPRSPTGSSGTRSIERSRRRSPCPWRCSGAATRRISDPKIRVLLAWKRRGIKGIRRCYPVCRPPAPRDGSCRC